jgi:hypothetical protein
MFSLDVPVEHATARANTRGADDFGIVQRTHLTSVVVLLPPRPLPDDIVKAVPCEFGADRFRPPQTQYFDTGGGETFDEIIDGDVRAGGGEDLDGGWRGEERKKEGVSSCSNKDVRE